MAAASKSSAAERRLMTGRVETWTLAVNRRIGYCMAAWMD